MLVLDRLSDGFSMRSNDSDFGVSKSETLSVKQKLAVERAHKGITYRQAQAKHIETQKADLWTLKCGGRGRKKELVNIDFAMIKLA